MSEMKRIKTLLSYGNQCACKKCMGHYCGYCLTCGGKKRKSRDGGWKYIGVKYIQLAYCNGNPGSNRAADYSS